MMEYKGYQAAVIFDEEAEIFHGEVVNLRDVITFQGKSVAELKRAFKESVQDYLDFCAARNEQPEKPFSGKFTLRLEPLLHQRIYARARSEGQSLNEWVVKQLARVA